MKITHNEECWFDSILSFSSLHLLLLPCDNSTIPHSTHIAKFSLHKSQRQLPSYHRLHSSGLHTSQNLRVLDWGCRINGVRSSNHILWWFTKSSNLWVDLHWNAQARVLWIRVSWNSFETLPEFFSVLMQAETIWNKVSPTNNLDELAFLLVLHGRLRGTHLAHTFKYQKSPMMQLTFPLLI